MRIVAAARGAFFLSIFVTAASVLPASPSDCAGLVHAHLPNTTISVAQSIPAGHFTPPYGKPQDQLPAFCRVAGVIRPTADSYIRFEVWLPLTNWNGKYLGVGNGGFAGSIDYNGMAGDLRRGYATAGTDTGHEAESEDATWAFRHPEKVKDFGYRALHETTADAKRLVEAFYRQPAKRSYFDSCSDGGREALMEAQRFPEDFDGILAGAPANNWTRLLTSDLDITKALYGNPVDYISTANLPALSAAVLAACDAQDGVKDGVLTDPTRCHFNPETLLCKEPESRMCLTAPQITALRKIYAGGSTSHGQQIFPGFTPGSEEGTGGWGPWILGPGPSGSSGALFLVNYFRYMVMDDPSWNPLTADIDASEEAADSKTAQDLNSTDPDLRRFHARGGKLILYHGWNDPAISPINTVNYYQSVVSTMGATTVHSFARLYMIPGMQHCMGGPGATSFGQLGSTTAAGPEHGIYSALEQWVENGAAPGDIIATKYVGTGPNKTVEMTRPICPYPQAPAYKGSGDTNDYRNFVCQAAAVTPVHSR